MTQNDNQKLVDDMAKWLRKEAYEANASALRMRVGSADQHFMQSRATAFMAAAEFVSNIFKENSALRGAVETGVDIMDRAERASRATLANHELLIGIIEDAMPVLKAHAEGVGSTDTRLYAEMLCQRIEGLVSTPAVN